MGTNSSKNNDAPNNDLENIPSKLRNESQIKNVEVSGKVQ